MKRIFLFFTITSSVICSHNNQLIAQDKKADFKLGNGEEISKIAPCGDDEFYILYGEETNGRICEFNIMKLDKDLHPLWAKPIIYKNKFRFGNSNIIYSYTNPADKKTISYIYDVDVKPGFGSYGTSEFLQVLPDGTSKEIKTDIPKNELEYIAAVFTDVHGFNIITFNGEKEYPSGNMNWYIFSHDQLNMTKKNIILPLPPGTDKDNAYDWWLNEVSSDGLYFSYISYKNNVKAPGPILSCNIIKVNSAGKPGNIINIDMNCDKYNIIQAYYTRNILLKTMPIVDGSTHSVWQHSSDFCIFHPHINKPKDTYKNSATEHFDSYMGVRVDESNNRIYTIFAVNDQLEVESDGSQKWKEVPIKSFRVAAYDLTGKKINQSIIDHVLGRSDLNITRAAQRDAFNISLNLLQNNEGFICKAINDNNGFFIASNKDGKVEKQNEFTLFAFKEHTALRFKDVFPAFYKTMKDFENSPDLKGSQSPEVQFFNKMDEDSKSNTLYLSLKSGDIIAKNDSKNHLVKLSYFNKK